MNETFVVLEGVLLVGAALLVWRIGRQISALERFARQLAEGKEGEKMPDFPPALRRAAELFRKMARRHTRLEQSFAQEKLELEAILSSMAEGLVVVNERHVIRRVNASAMALFGLNSSPVGQTILTALREAPIEEVVRQALSTDTPQSREITLFRGTQSTRHLMVNASPIPQSKDEAGEVVIVVHEITKLRQLEDLRRDFVANVSHELRTPLSIFQGYVEMLMDAPDLPKGERMGHLEIMRRNSQRLNALLEDLLTLARLEARQDKLQPQALVLRPILERLAEEWSAKLGSRSLEMPLSADLPLLWADEARLEQILNNLLENAVKFTAEQGAIEIRAETKGSDFVISISDNGMGIPPTDLPHIFERFYRVEKARSRHAGGTGLGLSIVKHLMTLHGGAVEAQSNYGVGTTIRLRFPFSAPV